ncbi:sensor histidine kinase [Parvularcula lutaonensis]|uniref:histidine kinase n=1 Tax=Parvularcula lutaonensis TaxID=491923 RepID=A0ABV7MEI5_9PROT|nr:sensor histidine kinase [Parvularcula lutaonensis]GGY55582.1 hypothetical protein GCM10007148_26850 [Parvularcula lutaonensis]
MAASRRTPSKAVPAQNDAASRATLALAAGKMGSWEWDIEGGTVTGDPIVGTYFELDDVPQPWPVERIFKAMHPDDEAAVRKAVEAALDDDVEYHTEFRIARGANQPELWLGARGRVVARAEDGRALRMLGVNWDMSEEKEHERKLGMLASEMDHRVKNAFAVMRALIRLASKSAVDVQSLASTLEAQAIAMAEAHALSAKLSHSEGSSGNVPLQDILNTALKPWMERPADNGSVTVSIDSPENIVLPSAMISPVAMLVYELATNAAKHGPLGERGGKLEVAITQKDGKITFIWNEYTGDAPVGGRAIPADALESRRFGSVLVQQCASTLGAETERALTPDGLRFRMVIPYPSDEQRTA